MADGRGQGNGCRWADGGIFIVRECSSSRSLFVIVLLVALPSRKTIRVPSINLGMLSLVLPSDGDDTIVSPDSLPFGFAIQIPTDDENEQGVHENTC